MKIRHTILLGFALIGAFLLATALLNLILSNKVRENSRWYRRSMENMQDAISLEKNIIDQETALRGYLLTGNSIFLEPSTKAEPMIPAILTRLTRRSEDKTSQSRHLESVKNTYRVWMDSIYRPDIKTRSYSIVNNNIAQAFIIERTKSGGEKSYMDNIRFQINAFLEDEAQTLRIRQNGFNRTIALLRILNILFLISSVITGGVTAYKVSRMIELRLQPLNKAAKRIAEGNYDVTISTHHYHDELEPFTLTFNEMTQRLHNTFNRLQQNITDLEHFNWITSHDLKEPLRMVSIYMQLLKKKNLPLDEEAREYMTYIDESIKRMILLINSLLEYARIDKAADMLSRIDISRILDRVLEDLNMIIKEKGAEVKLNNLPESVCGIDFIIAQVFSNLIQNGIKYNKSATPEVQVSAEDAGDFWQFSVADNGIGIDEAYHEKVFVIFKRLHGNEEYSGTGIGLAICKKVIERHGGQIWFRSQSGQGTTFYFTLPKNC